MGHLAAALGVAPGTATTMVKTLAEAGLVQYEPYAGVALTPAGAKLAALVVRRHRVIEVFLVKVMGYRWDEVHDEAEQLEHVVSERLIDRMDEMLGRPEVDPHGDPIPDAEGIVKPQEAQNLLTCPLHTRVTVTRVLDQDKVFLRFIENHNLKPGRVDRGRGPRRRLRQRPRARQGRPADHHRHARRVEAAGAGRAWLAERGPHVESADDQRGGGFSRLVNKLSMTARRSEPAPSQSIRHPARRSAWNIM